MTREAIPWYVRRSARWMALSLAARGAVEGIVVAMGGQREMQLPPSGLPSLAHLLGRPWTEVEPAVAEALEVGKLEYDAERRVIIDPSCDDAARRRDELAEAFAGLMSRRPTPTPPTPPTPPPPRGTPVLEERPSSSAAELAPEAPTTKSPSQTKAAVRARLWRAQRKAQAPASMLTIDAQEHCGTQLELPVREGAFARTFANAFAPGSCGSADDSQAFAVRSRTDASLSGSSKSSRKQREPRVQLAASMPMQPGWLERAREIRPDLPAENVTKSWSRFTRWNAARQFPSWQVIATAWEGWLERELSPRESKPAPSTSRVEAPATPAATTDPYRPAKLARPDEEPPAPSTGPRIVKVTPRAPEEIAAAQRLAMGAWS